MHAKHRIAAAIVLVAATSATPAMGVMTLEAEVREAEDRLRTAMLTNDVAALTVLLDDELQFSGPDGAVLGKQDDLAAHAARRLQLSRLDLKDSVIEVHGLIASVRVRAVLAGTFDGGPCDGTYRYTRTWRKKDGRWQVVAADASELRVVSPTRHALKQFERMQSARFAAKVPVTPNAS